MLTLVSIVAAVVAVFLGLSVVKRFAAGGTHRSSDERRASSRFISRADFIDGRRQLAVSLALSGSAIHYEGSDMRDSLDLDWIQEVHYEDGLVTGQHVGEGRILRLCCFSRMFEFIVPTGALEQWQIVLPARRQTAARNTPVIGAPVVTNPEWSRAEDDGWPVQALPAQS